MTAPAADADSIMLVGPDLAAAAAAGPEFPRRPMFENPPRSSKALLPRGVVVSLLIHAGAVLFLIQATSGANVPIARTIDVTFLKYRMALPPPPLPPLAAKQKSRSIAKPVQPRPTVSRTIVAPKALPQEKPPEVPPEEQPQETGDEGGTDEGEPGGVANGVPGGVAGGVVGGIVGSPPQSGPLDFNDAMTPPTLVAGPSPQYTDEALESGVQGLMLIRCIVTIDGNVKQCRVVQGLPFMDRAVVDALEHRRYTPALLQGRPVEVDYTFRIRLSLPQ